MNILFFTEISPFPINGGERIRSYGLIKALSLLNYRVTAIIQNKDSVNLSDFKIDNVHFIEFRLKKKSKIEKIFASHFFNKDSNVIRIFNKLLLKNNFDIVFLDYYLSGKYVTYFKKAKIPVIIGTHNVESKLIHQLPSKNIFHTFRNFHYYLWMKIHEFYYYKLADALISVSDEDYNYYCKYLNPEKLFMIPNFLDELRYNKQLKRENYFIMTANFGAYMNFEGLKWLLTKVWNKKLDANHTLLLVGKKSIESLEKLEDVVFDFKNVRSIGEVDDMVPYILKAKAVFIPLLQGSGTRLKCLEAMALKTPIIGTSKGVEGIKSNHIIIADTVSEFRSKIHSFCFTEDIGENLYKDFMHNYSLSVNNHRIKKMFAYLLRTKK